MPGSNLHTCVEQTLSFIEDMTIVNNIARSPHEQENPCPTNLLASSGRRVCSFFNLFILKFTDS
jgi:hypothetical protein